MRSVSLLLLLLLMLLMLLVTPSGTAPKAQTLERADAPAATASQHHPNMVGIQAMGEGMSGSFHYERLLMTWQDSIRLLARGGVGYFPYFINGEAALGTWLFPLGLRALYGFGCHHVELGSAWTTAVTFNDAGRHSGPLYSGFFTPSLGYRYQDFASGSWTAGLAWAPRISQGMTQLQFDSYIRLEVGFTF